MILRRPSQRAVLLSCVPVLGCLNTDFGRVRPSLVDDNIHAWIGAEAAIGTGRLPSEFPLTDEERLLRDLAYPLIAPPYERQRWYSVLYHYGFTRRLTPEIRFAPVNYAGILLAEPRRSTTSLYGQLIEDIRNDVVRVGPFFAAARTVVDLDAKRRKSLAYVSALSPEEFVNTERRISENALIIEWVHLSLHDRVAAYRFALERLVIIAPATVAVEAERSLTLLKVSIPPPLVAGILVPGPATRKIVTKG